MPIETKLVIALVSFLILLAIIQLVRQGRLDEKYALLWLILGSLMIVAPVANRVIDSLSHALGIYYPPAFVFLIAFLGLCLINLQYSVVISRLTRQNKMLAQRFALLEKRLKDIEAEPLPRASRQNE